MCVCANEDITNSCLNELLSEAANYLRNIRLSEESSMTVISTNMEAQRAFLSAVTFERQKSWKKVFCFTVITLNNHVSEISTTYLVIYCNIKALTSSLLPLVTQCSSVSLSVGSYH